MMCREAAAAHGWGERDAGNSLLLEQGFDLGAAPWRWNRPQHGACTPWGGALGLATVPAVHAINH